MKLNDQEYVQGIEILLEDGGVIDKKTLYPSFKNPESTVTYIDKKSKYTLEVNANSFYGEIGDKVFFSEVVEWE